MNTTENFFPNSSSKIASWSFSGAFGKNFEKLVNLQMWCFGCDIRRSESNLVLDFGFERTRPPYTAGGSSHYRLTFDSTYTVHLWGFAMVIADEAGALCVRRFERSPSIVRAAFDPHSIFKSEGLPTATQPTNAVEREYAQRLLRALCRFLVRYETFLLEKNLLSFRSTAVRTSPKAARLRGDPLPLPLWRAFLLDSH